MQLSLYVLLVALFFSLTGCASSAVKRPMPSEGSRPDTAGQDARQGSASDRAPTSVKPDRIVERIYVLPDDSFFDQRVRALELKQQAWREQKNANVLLKLTPSEQNLRDTCMETVDSILSEYSRIKERCTGEKGGDDEYCLRVWGITARDIAYLEGRCPSAFAAHAQSLTSASAAARTDQRAMAMASLDRQLAAGLFAEALRSLDEVMQKNPEEKKNPELQKRQGLVLLRNGQFEQAASVFGELAQGSDASFGGWPVQRFLADALFASGRFGEAKNAYEALADRTAILGNEDFWVSDKCMLLADPDNHSGELGLYVPVLQAWFTFDGKQMPMALADGARMLAVSYPGSIFSKSAGNLWGQAESRVKGRSGEGREKEGRAVGVSESGPVRPPLEERNVVMPLPAEVKGATELPSGEVTGAGEAQRQAAQQALKGQWDEVNKKFDLRLYDEAIQGYVALFDTAYDPEARKKVQEATDLAAADKREQAANLFAKARKSSDTNTRRQYLVACRALLSEILRRYPQAAVVGKARQNLKAVDAYIAEIDPGMLEDAGEIRRIVPGQGLDGADETTSGTTDGL